MSKIKLISGGATAQLILLEEHRRALSVAELEKATAEPSRAEGKAKTKAAVDELVEAGKEQIVLAHIHPSWLRGYVAELIDGGIQLGPKGLERLRLAGPATGRKLVDAMKAARVGGKPANV